MRLYYAFTPHVDADPGNYLFLSDGRLGLIDFGCVQHFDAEQHEIVLLADRMVSEDASLTREVVRRVCGVLDDDPAQPDYLQMMEESRDWMMEPLSKPGPFDFGGAAHFQRGLDCFSHTVQKRITLAKPMFVYWNRSIFGIKALLYRLGAQIDVHEMLRQEGPR